MERGTRRAVVALAFAIAAALACWHPLSAPFGLLAGIGALIVSLRALGGGPPGRRTATAGVVLSLLAVLASGFVLARTAGVGRSPTGEPVVAPRTPDDVDRILDEAAKEGRDARARARDELRRLAPAGLTPSGK